MYSFPSFELVCCSMSSSNCCFLTCIQVSQEAGKVVWYFHLFKNFPVCYSHSQRLWHSQWSRSRCFSGILLLFLWSNSPVQSLSHVWLLQSHGLQHTRLPCPSSTPGTCLNSCPSSRWCHPTNSSSVVPISSLQSFPASGLFYWVSSLHQVAKVLELQLQYQSFQWIFRSTDVGNLISGSSAFCKSSLNIWKFMLHILLKPSLKDFEDYFSSVWNECNFAVVWTFFGIAVLWDWNENWPLPVLWPLESFPNLLAYWVQHFHGIIF